MVLILIGYLHMPKHKLVAYTDGACSGNPGPGGWGVLLQAFSDGKVVKERELSNGEKRTTNNKMELRAAIAALEILDRTSEITIITDSKYVMNGIQTWLAGWKKTIGKLQVKSQLKMKNYGNAWIYYANNMRSTGNGLKVMRGIWVTSALTN